MSTYEQRLAQMQKVSEDPLVTLQEKVVFIVTWVRYEHALRRAAKIDRKISRLQKTLKNSLDQYNFRHLLHNLS